MSDIVFPAAAGTAANVLYSYFSSVLNFRGIADRLFTRAQITAGLETTVYATEAAATGGGDPASVGIPNFRIVDDGATSVKLAYWDYLTGAGGTWSVTSAPYDYPTAFAPNGPAITANNGNHAANAAFNTFGCSNIYQVLQDCNITQIAHHQQGAGAGAATAFSFIRSLVKGSATQPPDASFVEVLQSLLVIPSVSNQWTTLGLATTVALNKGDWLALQGAAVATQSTATTTAIASDENNDLIRVSGYRVDFSPPGRTVAPTTVDGFAASLSLGGSITVQGV